MASHDLVFELFYDGAWHAAPVYVRDGCTIKRGTDAPGSESDPASATLTLDNRSGYYSPRSIVSPLYGKIGQNTKARLTVDGDIRLVGEVASWKPERAIKGDAWTKIQVAGVLQRIGRGTDPIQSALTRAIVASSPGVFWPLDDVAGSTEAGSGVGGPSMTMTGTVDFAEHVDLPGTECAADMGTGSLHAAVPDALSPANQDVSWVAGFGMKTPTYIVNDPHTFIPMLTWITPGATGAYVRWELVTSIVELGDITLQAVYSDGTAIFYNYTLPSAFDNRWHYYEFFVRYVASTDRYELEFFIDGVSVGTSSRVEAGASVGGVTDVYINRNGYDFTTFGISQVYVSNNTDVVPVAGVAMNGYAGETAADRFARLCLEQAITATVVGDPDESVAMGPQLPLTLLGEFDEVGRTDDASIFETKDDIGLTMRTGVSKLNQTPAFTISYIGQVQPGLSPVYGDEGIRNDVTATSPGGSSRRVQQLDGPHNVQLPEDDPQGVGRYQTRIDVNPATSDALSDAAGWRVNLGTYDGTWYAKVTADLDAAPSVAAFVAALDIGDVLAISELPDDEALDTVESVIIGIEEEVLPKRRLVTFYCVPAAPYRVGILAQTSGDTDPFLGHLDTDGSTTTGVTLAGAATFSVATPSGPLWTTVADDFPFDVIVGGQRVSVSSIAGGSSPQTFTVQVGGHQVVYPIPDGSAVNVQQPVILSL